MNNLNDVLKKIKLKALDQRYLKRPRVNVPYPNLPTDAIIWLVRDELEELTSVG